MEDAVHFKEVNAILDRMNRHRLFCHVCHRQSIMIIVTVIINRATAATTITTTSTTTTTTTITPICCYYRNLLLVLFTTTNVTTKSVEKKLSETGQNNELSSLPMLGKYVL